MDVPATELAVFSTLLSFPSVFRCCFLSFLRRSFASASSISASYVGLYSLSLTIPS